MAGILTRLAWSGGRETEFRGTRSQRSLGTRLDLIFRFPSAHLVVYHYSPPARRLARGRLHGLPPRTVSRNETDDRGALAVHVERLRVDDLRPAGRRPGDRDVRQDAHAEPDLRPRLRPEGVPGGGGAERGLVLPGEGPAVGRRQGVERVRRVGGGGGDRRRGVVVELQLAGGEGGATAGGSGRVGRGRPVRGGGRRLPGTPAAERAPVERRPHPAGGAGDRPRGAGGPTRGGVHHARGRAAAAGPAV